MKTILLWDPRFPLAAPVRLTIADEVASAFVRAGVAAAADPADAGALATGAPINPAEPTEIVIWSGWPARPVHVVVPRAAAAAAIQAGVAAVAGGGAALNGVVPTNPYVLDINYGAGEYFYNGVTYATEAELLTAASGVNGGGIKRVFGPWADPDGPELVPDPTVATGAGWAAYQDSAGTGDLSASGPVSGEYRLNAATAARHAWGGVAIPVQKGTGYLATGKIRKDPGASYNAKFAVTNDPTNLSALAAGSALSGSATFASYSLTFSPYGEYQTMVVGVYAQNSGFTGMLAADDVSVKEAIPFAGFGSGEASGLVVCTMGASDPVADQDILHGGDGAVNGSPQNRALWHIVRGVDKHVYLRVTYPEAVNGTVPQCNIDLGLVANGASATIAFALTEGVAAAKLGSNAAVTATLNNMPATTMIRIGRSDTTTTNDFAGTIQRVAFYRQLTAPEGVSLTVNPLNGDSYSRGLRSYLAAALGEAVSRTGVGGSSIAEQKGYFDDHPDLWDNLPYFHIDGASNSKDGDGTDTVEGYMAVHAYFAATLGAENFIMITPLVRASTLGDRARDDAITAQMMALYPYCIDLTALAVANAGGSAEDLAAVAGNYCPPSLLGDGVHPNATFYAIIAAAAAAKKAEWISDHS